MVEHDWPSEGRITFSDVELSYRPGTEVVLRKLNFEVTAGHKVGIVGRTGAGKSTISMALTRIVELAGGKIEIDGVDISQIDISDLRGQITMIPQDPLLFTGTLRFNLDPFDEQTDERITELVQKAGLGYLMSGMSQLEQIEQNKRLQHSDEDSETADDKKKDEQAK